MSKVLLVRPPSYSYDERKWVRDINVPFLLKYVEAVVKNNRKHHVQFIDCIADHLSWDNLTERTIELNPDIVIANTLTCDRKPIIEFAKRVKRHNTKTMTIVIGQDATANPNRYVFADSPCDFVALGECEFSILKLLDGPREDTFNKKIGGIYSNNFKDTTLQYVDDLSNLPLPSYTESELARYQLSYPVRMNKKVVWGHVLSSRGCPYKCIFCSQTIRQSYGRKIRLRPINSIVGEIEQLVSLGVNAIHFSDDDFSCSYTHVEEICSGLIKGKVGIKWAAQVRVDELDATLLRLMKESGCIVLRFGLESGSINILKKLKKTHDPELWLRKSRHIFPEARKLGIDTIAMFILGNPTESLDDMKETFQFAIDLNPDFLQLHYFTPYPGTDYYKENMAFLSSKMNGKIRFHYEPGYSVSQISPEDLLKTTKQFYRDFYFRIRYIIRHLYKFTPFYIKNPNILRPLLKQMIRQI